MNILANFQPIRTVVPVEMNPASVGWLTHLANSFSEPIRQIVVIPDGVHPETVNLVIHQ